MERSLKTLLLTCVDLDWPEYFFQSTYVDLARKEYIFQATCEDIAREKYPLSKKDVLAPALSREGTGKTSHLSAINTAPRVDGDKFTTHGQIGSHFDSPNPIVSGAAFALPSLYSQFMVLRAFDMIT